MSSALIMNVTVANAARDSMDPSTQLRQFLADSLPDIPVYRLVGRPGDVMAAGLDLRAVLSTSADLIAVATLLWQAYEQVVKTRRRPEAPEAPFVIVQVQRHDRPFVMFQMGRLHTSESEFVRDFESQVAQLRLMDDGPDAVELQWQLSEDERWARVVSRDS